ncbi:MAG: hypothetical protein KF774_18480 [Planctomyces sp.]|nr:hypothetical protein [Planctomyces sp.]
MPLLSRTRWLALASLAASSAIPAHLPAQEAEPSGPASPLAVEPSSPTELFRAVLFTLRLDRADVARRYLDAFLADNPDDDLLLQLRNDYGTGTFLELARVEALRPSSDDLLDRVRAAALARIADPVIVDRLINQLSGTPRERDAALTELRHLRAYAVPHILRRATALDSRMPAEQAVATLVALRQDAVNPLIAALRGGPDIVQGLAADALGWIGGREAELALWKPAFGESSSEGLKQSARRGLARILHGDADRTDLVDPFAITRRLDARADRQYRRELLPEAEADGLVGVWSWDAERNTLLEARTTPEAAALYFAELETREAIALGGPERARQSLLLAILLERDVERAGWQNAIPEGPDTAHDLALAAGPDAVEDALKIALKAEQPGAALSALRVLGQTGSRSRLTGKQGATSPVLEALGAPEPRVQFAAAETILQWDPDQPFPQARRVVEILARALNAEGRRDGVVIDPNARRATEMGDFLNTLGYDPHITRTGLDGFQEVAARGDVALAVIHLNSIRWDLSQTIANLRADARTRNVPIAVYGPSGLQDRVRHLQEQHRRVAYLEESRDSFDVQRQLRPLLAQVSPPAMTDAQRRDMQASAVYWLQHIAEGRRTNVFELGLAESALSNALNVPELAAPALSAIGAIATPGAQERLLDSAVNTTQPADIRRIAARQLGFHIQRFGLLLSGDSMSRLRSAVEVEDDPRTHTALIAVLGSLNPDAQRVQELLKSAPPPQPPLE